MNEGSVWRNVLSIVVTCFLVIRLIFTCSNTNKNNSSDFAPQPSYIEDAQKVMQETIERNNKIRTYVSNNVLYKTYESLDSLSPLMKKEFGVIKLERDSLVYVDMYTTLKIPKNFYLQNNHDDTLKMAFKSPQNLNIFIHDFDSKKGIAENFKSVKLDKELQKFKEQKLGGFKMLTYKITKDKKRFNGFALCLQAGDYQEFYEFESTDLPADMLRQKAIDFLSENLKEDKKRKK